MRIEREIFKEFPKWFNENIWKNVRIEQPISMNPWEDDYYIFDFNLFNNQYKVRIMLSFDRFYECYKRCYENKERTFWLMSEIINNEFWTELRRYADQQLRGK